MAKETAFRKLSAGELRWRCNPEKLGFKSTKDLEASKEIIGQPRATEAIRVGLEIEGFGYNIFVTGLEGTGKSTIVKDYVAKHAGKLRKPNDWCLVNNFKDEFRPRAIEVPSGKGIPLSKKMNRFIQNLKKIHTV